jgi:hypothetical protein
MKLTDKQQAAVDNISISFWAPGNGAIMTCLECGKTETGGYPITHQPNCETGTILNPISLKQPVPLGNETKENKSPGDSLQPFLYLQPWLIDLPSVESVSAPAIVSQPRKSIGGC